MTTDSGETRANAPWSLAEVDALNERQKDPNRHPYTCPRHSSVPLVAHQNGWWCGNLRCTYRQTWALPEDVTSEPFMAGDPPTISVAVDVDALRAILIDPLVKPVLKHLPRTWGASDDH